MKVRNDDSVANGTTLATLVGHQDGVEIFAKSMIVPAIPSGNASTMVDFGSYTPHATGVITWTATITDADPDDDIAVETTQAK